MTPLAETVIQHTVSEPIPSRLSALLVMVNSVFDWESGVSVGLELNEARDDCSWALGALAERMTDDRFSGGRPAKADNAHRTVTALAEELAIERGKLSQLKSNWLFYKDALDRIPENSNWDICSDCRRKSGWEPGEEITAEYQERALWMIQVKVDRQSNRARREPLTIEDALGRAISDLERYGRRCPKAEPKLRKAIEALK